MQSPIRVEEQTELAPLVQGDDAAPEFDQYAQDLGLVLAPFWPASSPLTLPLNALDLTTEETVSYPAHLTTPTQSDPAFQGLELPPIHAGLDLPPARSAHELFLRKGSSDTKFIGMGSVGSTISECLRDSVSAHGASMESTILAHLVNGIRHVDELAVSGPFQRPLLPERDFAERGIQAYYDFLHLLYPIMDAEFLDSWRQIYDDTNYSLSAIQYCRLCLVILVGNIVSPSRSYRDSWESSQRLHEQIWSLLDRIMATPFIESLQVMLLHTVFLLYCGKTGIAWMACGMAVHIAQSLGLHQHPPSQLALNAQQTTLRSRLWSVAYTLDAFLSLSEGRPSTITSPLNLGLATHRLSAQEQGLKSPDLYIHDWHVSLATISSRVVALLKNSDSLLGTLAQIGDIDAQLLAWKDSIPMQFRPDQQILADDDPPLYFLVAMLHLKYHNLMRTIHWISLTFSTELAASGGSTSNTGIDPALNLAPRIRTSESICLTSSRSVIEVLNGFESRAGSRAGGGFIVPYCMAAISVFYRQIVKEPTRHSARADLEYMRSGTLHVTALLDGVESRRHFRVLFGEMVRVAEEVVKAAN